VTGKVLQKSSNFGFNAQKESMWIRHGGHRTEVARTALEDAAFVVSILITTEAVIAEKPKDKSPRGGTGAMRHGLLIQSARRMTRRSLGSAFSLLRHGVRKKRAQTNQLHSRPCHSEDED
jgi:hypothetical protein